MLENEEGQNMEFKGHRAFAPEDVNQLNRQEGQLTRQNIAKYACGMLNTVGGGLILAGVLDDGRVEGFLLNKFQRDHFVLTVQETFKRFDPPVPENRYSIHFVPVVDSESEEPEDEDKLETFQRFDNMPHQLLTAHFCWCDYNASAALTKGLLNSFYVIELRFRGHREAPRKVFKSSDGIAYVRRMGMTEVVSSPNQED